MPAGGGGGGGGLEYRFLRGAGSDHFVFQVASCPVSGMWWAHHRCASKDETYDWVCMLCVLKAKGSGKPSVLTRTSYQ